MKHIKNFEDFLDYYDRISSMTLKEAEMIRIKETLIANSGNRTKAAQILGISVRTMRNKINGYRKDDIKYFLSLK